MLRNRLLMGFGGCLLAASAAWADEVGYVDCSNHSDDTQVFAKARKTPEVLASIPCGERFTVLIYGFVFSRVQTKDGNIGYVFSNLIAVDRAATAAGQFPTAQNASAKEKIPSTRYASTPAAAVAKPQAATVQASAAQVSPTQAAPVQVASNSSAQPAEIVMKSSASASVTPQPAAAPSAAVQASPAPATPAQASSNVAASATVEGQPVRNVAAMPDPAASQPAPAPAPATAAQPSRDALAQPDPAPAPAAADPVTPPVKPADTRSRWEQPRPGGVRRAPLLELFGGFSFARMDNGGGSTSNLNGAIGSFGWNIKPWLQIVGDSSYNMVTVSGTKSVLYGNHFGPRYFHRTHGRWGLTPFAEALVGGSRADVTFAGSSTYNTSQNCISFKVGGGLDIHPSRHIDIRLFDADYYRTSFGTSLHQTNYSVSTGVVLRLFGGGSE